MFQTKIYKNINIKSTKNTKNSYMVPKSNLENEPYEHTLKYNVNFKLPVLE